MGAGVVTDVVGVRRSNVGASAGAAPSARTPITAAPAAPPPSATRETRRGRAVSIVWNPFGRGWFFEKGERHYDVTYVDRHSGGTVTVGCKTSMFTGVYWADGETATEAPRRILSHHRCAKCGYAIQVEWRACPNCGKETEFA